MPFVNLGAARGCLWAGDAGRYAATSGEFAVGYLSTEDPIFRSAVGQWLEQCGEVSALIRYSHAAGSKSFEFFHTMEAFSERLRQLPRRACVTVFREPQLPLRGRVDEEFRSAVLAHIPDGAEYLIAGLEEVSHRGANWFRFLSGESRAELAEDLSECLGEEVAVGVYPLWLYDNDQVTSAVVPEKDGSVVCGIY